MWSWRHPFRKPATAELDKELRFHLEELVCEKIGQGIPPIGQGATRPSNSGAWRALKSNVNDATTFSVVVATKFLVALLASAVPAIRASRRDPMQVLRDE
jgi:ABC-type lipoprotein release transport system permease subunit